MSEPYLAEIRIISFNFPPKGWAFCNGQLLPINQNQALFSLLGTTYGGNGSTNFALPDLRGRVPIHFGNSASLGERAGEESHTLINNEMPGHTHPVGAVANPATLLSSPVSNLWATSGTYTIFGASPNVSMAAAIISPAGSTQPHQNLPPYLTVNFVICLAGIFPSRS